MTLARSAGAGVICYRSPGAGRLAEEYVRLNTFCDFLVQWVKWGHPWLGAAPGPPRGVPFFSAATRHTKSAVKGGALAERRWESDGPPQTRTNS
jgi:hypothetical protein